MSGTTAKPEEKRLSAGARYVLTETDGPQAAGLEPRRIGSPGIRLARREDDR